MSETLAFNPGAAGTAKKGKGGTMSTAIVKKKKKKNPSAKSIAKSAGRRAKATWLGLNVGSAFKSSPARIGGMFAGRWVARRFGSGAADHEEWSFADYMWTVGGGFVAGALVENIRKGSGQKFLEGAIALAGYHALQDKVVSSSDFLESQFGDDRYDDDDDYDYYEPGQVAYGDDGVPYMYGADDNWYPLNEQHRGIDLGQTEPPGVLGQTEPPGVLGQDDVDYWEAHTW